jgi:hypothetical protein
MCGFHKDVLPFYRDASAFLMTSEYEGFPTVLSESQAAGVPCVMYELPYLSLTQANKGFIGVELGAIDAAADAVSDLLIDPAYRRAMGRDARANVQALAQFDFPGVWSGVFERFGQVRTASAHDSSQQIMWETFLGHYRTGADRRDAEASRLKTEIALVEKAIRKSEKRRRKAQAELTEIDSSTALRIGTALTFIPRAIRGLRRRLKRA